MFTLIVKTTVCKHAESAICLDHLTMAECQDYLKYIATQYDIIEVKITKE